MSQPCPCGRLNPRGRPLAFENCCAPYLDHGVDAPDAESLMRSRYSAFVLERPAYLLASWHATTRPPELTLDPGIKWLGLAIKGVKSIDADHAEVAFVARSRVGGRGQRLEERSRFVRDDGRWLYIDGEIA
jgi:SEC-C motif domain protein